MEYVMVRDICNHEDYPCCGCSRESYPMEKSDAKILAKEGKVKIVGKYRPQFYGGDFY